MPLAECQNAGEADGTDSPFDVHVIHQLVRLMKRYDLMSIDLVEGPTKIRLRRRNETPAPTAALPAYALACTQPRPHRSPPLRPGSRPCRGGPGVG